MAFRSTYSVPQGAQRAGLVANSHIVVPPGPSSFTRTASDSLSTSDVATANLVLTRTATDSLGTSDSATRTSQAFARTAPGILRTKDDWENMVVNPSAETGVAGVGLDNATLTSVTQATDSPSSASGTKSFEITVATANQFTVLMNHYGPNNNTIDPTDSRVITNPTYPDYPDHTWSFYLGFSVKVVSVSGGGSITSITGGQGRYTPGTNVYLGAFSPVSQIENPVTGTWYTQTLTVPTFDSIHLQAFVPAINVQTTGTITQVVLRVDAVIAGVGPATPSAYFDGDSSGGARWAGTAHASASLLTRARRAAQTFTRSSTDALGTSDSATRLVAFSRTASDALGTTDAAAQTSSARAVSDTLGTSDAAARAIQTFTRTTSDTLGTSDTATRAAQTFTSTATDTLGTSDSATRSVQSFTRSASDALGTSDTATREASARLRTVAESLGTTDSATQTASQSRTASDSLVTSDSATRSAGAFTRSATDTLGSSDSATRVAILLRLASDSLGTTDAATRSFTVARAATDTLATSDSARQGNNSSKDVFETLGTTDSATRAATTVTRFSLDGLATSDSASASVFFIRSSSETVSTTDVATRSISPSRQASDVATVSDSATQQKTTVVYSVDSLATTDAVSAVFFGARLVADTATLTDAVTIVLIPIHQIPATSFPRVTTTSAERILTETFI